MGIRKLMTCFEPHRKIENIGFTTWPGKEQNSYVPMWFKLRQADISINKKAFITEGLAVK